MPNSRTIFHSDRESQYGSVAFRVELKRCNVLISTSAKANPYDNAWSESFMGTLRKELLQGAVFESHEDSRIALFEYIEGYYNTQRKHSSNGYQSPVQFERNNQLNLKLTVPNIRCTSEHHVFKMLHFLQIYCFCRGNFILKKTFDFLLF